MIDEVAVSASARDAADEVSRLGSTVLRGVWKPEALAPLREAIAQFTELRLQALRRGVTLPEVRMYATHGVGNFLNLLNIKGMTTDVLRELFEGSTYHDICRVHFGDDEFYCLSGRLGFRNHDPATSDRSFIPYHQDSYTQDVRTPRVLNCWIPLDPGAGDDAPGLEVVRNPCRPNYPRKDFGLRSENAAYDFITIDRDRIVEDYGENFLAPKFEVGDGLVFSENVIHRTYVTPQMTKPRINFELRVFSPKNLSAGISVADLGPTCIRIA